MASPAAPPLTAPAPAPAAPAAPLSSTAIGQSVAADLMAQFARTAAPNGTNGAPPLPVQATPAATTPPVEAPPASPATPPAATPSATPAPATAIPETPPADLPPAPTPIEDFDFDAEPKPGEAPKPATTPEATPPAADKEPTPAAGPLEASLAKALETGEPDKVLGVVLQTSRGKRMLEAFKVQQELAKPFAEGGIGRVPTIEDIKAGEQSRLQMTEMLHEFQTNPESWVSNFFGYRDPQGQLVLRPGAPDVLTKIPEHVLKVDPSGNLFNTLAAATFTPYLESQAQRIGTMPQMTKDEADTKLRFADALWVMQSMLGLPQSQIQGVVLPGQPEGKPGQPDPFATERQRLADERKQFESQRQQAQSQQVEQRASFLTTNIESTVRADVDRLLTAQGVKEAYPEIVYGQLVSELLQRALTQVYGDPQQGIPPMNPSGFANYRIQFQQAAAGQLDPKLPVTAYRQMAQSAIRRIAPQFLEQVTNRAKATSDLRHQQAAQGASRTEAPSNGAAVATPPPAVPPAPGQRPQGMDMEDHIRQQLQQAMAMGGAIR